MTAKKASPRFRGNISVHLRGFGFVDFESAAEAPVTSAFVAPPDLNDFLVGDLVEAGLERSPDERYRAVDLKLIHRVRDEVLGTVERSDSRQGLALRLDPRIGNAAWPLKHAPQGLRVSQVVIGEPDAEAPRVDYLRAVPKKEVGKTAVLVVHGIATEMPERVVAEARAVRPRLKGRRDLRQVPTVTIDAAASKDLDDALAVLPVQDDGALRVLVSIADVDAGVPAGSELDAEARWRGTSVYLPDLVVPMLPPELSEATLSLLPGADRGTLTAELRIDREGDVTAVDLSASVIRSTARLTYTDTAAFLDRGETAGVPEGVRDTLRWLRTAASRLSAVRAARGGVTLERDEVALELDASTGEPTSVDALSPTSAHLLVERLMVATNEAVAGWLIDRGLPGLFRVQDEPEPDQVERLAAFAANFGFNTAFGGRLSARGLAAFEEQFKSATVAPSIRTVMRWLLGRARYQAAPTPHYALAAPAYLHFTSPIRRYADLVVHRIVKAHLRGERESYPDAAELDDIAAEINDAAYRARKAETDRLRMLIARLFADRIGETHAAHVVGVRPFGLQVHLDGLGVMGTVSTEALGGGPWHLDEDTYSLVSKERAYMVGEALTVRLASTDEDLGRIELEIVI